MLKKGAVQVNGVLATSATFVAGGETIVLTYPEQPIPSKKLILPLKVLFDDDHLAIIHKPAGILVSGNHFKTIARALPQNLAPSSLADAGTPQPVHRLDYATTGLLLVGKTNTSIRALNDLFETKQIVKIYYAITIGNMESSGVVNMDVDGKQARSRYHVCDSVVSKRFKILNLVRLTPKTGRRHQLRKHLAHIGNPILGDAVYGNEPLLLKGKGMYLHAYSLRFNHPVLEKEFYITDPLPVNFQKIFPDFKP